jgi:hypothetical protein
MAERIITVCALFAFLSVMTVHGVLSTQNEIRRYFEMPDYVGTVAENVQAAILEHVPLGSSEGEVERYLSSRGIASVGTGCARDTAGETLTCSLPVHHHRWELLGENYTVSFEFGTDAKLGRVEVRSHFVTALNQKPGMNF